MGDILKFITNIQTAKWRTFFIVKMVKHWKKMSNEVVGASSLEIFKIRLIGAQSNLM